MTLTGALEHAVGRFSWDAFPMANIGGRRWQPLYWLAYEPSADGMHTLSGFLSSKKGSTVDPGYEYRLVYDTTRDMWRLDQRVHTEGG